MIDADATSWCFSGYSDLHETGGRHIKCDSCRYLLCTNENARGFGDVEVICDDVTVALDWD
jgi:hypothetical protein